MVAQEFVDYLSKFKFASNTGFEDFPDKMNFLCSVMVLLLSILVVSVKQYIMKPISCYGATLPSGLNLLEYIENYCWIQGTIPVNRDTPLPFSRKTWAPLESTEKILYYQWVPFMLSIQCILFYLPRILWQIICANYGGSDLTTMTQKANEAQHSDPDVRDRKIENLVHFLKLWIIQRRNGFNHGGCLSCCLYSGVWLTFSYLFVKSLYLANSLGQLWLMHRFLGFDRYYNQSVIPLFGVNLARHIFTHRDWEITQIFPRVTYCRIPLRMIGPENYYIAQCVIPTNMLNEKIYIFLWFWISLVALVNLYGLTTWLVPFLISGNNKVFVKRLLNFCHEDLELPASLIRKFTSKFLSYDGLFMLRMIRESSGDLISSEIVVSLWNEYNTNRLRINGTEVEKNRQEEDDNESYFEPNLSLLNKDRFKRPLYKKLPEFTV